MLNEFLCYDECSQKDHELGNLLLNSLDLAAECVSLGPHVHTNRASGCKKEAVRGSAKNVHDTVWSAGADKNGCKKTENDM